MLASDAMSQMVQLFLVPTSGFTQSQTMLRQINTYLSTQWLAISSMGAPATSRTQHRQGGDGAPAQDPLGESEGARGIGPPNELVIVYASENCYATRNALDTRPTATPPTQPCASRRRPIRDELRGGVRHAARGGRRSSARRA